MMTELLLHADTLGYIAGACLLAMAYMKSQTHMRMCNIAGNCCFIAYGLINGLMPVLILNSIIMCLHIYRLMPKKNAAATA